MFGVFAFLLASSQVMYTSHRLRFIYLFRLYICVFTLCCVRVGLTLGMVHWLQKVFFSAKWTRSEIFQLRVKTYSLRPLCAPSLTLISGYRHAWSRSSVQVVYIVIELSTSRGCEGSLCWMTSRTISVLNGTRIGIQYSSNSAQFNKCGLHRCAKYALIKLLQTNTVYSIYL